ncbi:putative hydrolase [Brucella thiophenivorans]|uniref:Putative hydrolase n=1 Tax=Brucella thiophenivorans TaxID=571255 RepID=A0A256F985_9HYPH|nr:putative hydrolase [Brucella thiophenivorans]
MVLAGTAFVELQSRHVVVQIVVACMGMIMRALGGRICRLLTLRFFWRIGVRLLGCVSWR